MNSTKLWMTAQTPSAFGMPISGHSYGVTTPATGACAAAATTLVVRERAAIAAGTGLAQSDFPGTSAWRPPTC